MQERLFLDSKSARIEDANGFLIVRHNPIAKSGVFEYSGRALGMEGTKSNETFQVYKPFEELQKAAKQFEGMPITLRHQWVEGDNTNPVIMGTIAGSVTAEEPYLYADIKIINEQARAAIESGQNQELSPGYTADYIEEPGEFDGEPYDFVQRNIKFNHLALVNEGRSGHDLRVLDEEEKKMRTEDVDIDKLKNLLVEFFNEEKKEDVHNSNTLEEDESMFKDEYLDEEEVVLTDDDEVITDEDEVVATDEETLEEDEVALTDDDEVIATDDDEVITDEDEATVGCADEDETVITDDDEVVIADEDEVIATDDDEVIDEDEVVIADEEDEDEAAAPVTTQDAREIAMDAIRQYKREHFKSMKAFDEVSAVVGKFKTYDSKGDIFTSNKIYGIGCKRLGLDKVDGITDYKSAFKAAAFIKGQGKRLGYRQEAQRAMDEAENNATVDDLIKKAFRR